MGRSYSEEEIEELKEKVKENPDEVELEKDKTRNSLQCSDDSTRADTAFILARLARVGNREKVRPFHETLKKLLSDPHERSRLNSTWALSYLTTEYPGLAQPAISDLMNLLTDDNKKTRRAAIKTLSKLSDTHKGDVEMGIEAQLQILEQNLKRSVIVLGSFEDEKKSELDMICTRLQKEGYDAHLIDELPEHPMMSLQEKVRFWTSAARFCVMVDRQSSGHVYEHQLVKEQRTILALFRPDSGGSTWMFGEEPLVDYEFINTFEFQNHPEERLDDAIRWAERIAEERVDVYSELYEWREEGG